MMKVTGLSAYNKPKEEEGKSLVYDCVMRVFSGIQFFAFIIAVGFAIAFICCSVKTKEPKQKIPVEQSCKTDTTVFILQCECAIQETPKKRNRQANTCVKYVRLNTCNDTIVPKVAFLSRDSIRE